MSLMSLILALAPALAPRNHTSTVEEKINAAENDALDLAALLIDAKTELTAAVKAKDEAEAYVAEANRQRNQALSALADERDVTIALRRELADMTRQRDYAFDQTRAARNFAHQLQLEMDLLRAFYAGQPQQNDEQMRAQTELVAAGDRFQATALLTPVEPIPYPEPSPALLEARAALQRAQVLMAMPVFADVPVHSNGDGPMRVSDPGHTHHLADNPLAQARERVLWSACTCVPGRADAFRHG
jgi:hypothetical protein